MMSDLLNYFKAQAERESAYNQYNYAGQKLANARIKERYTEIRSQYDPIESIIKERFPLINDNDKDKIRQTILEITKYVVLGQTTRSE